MAYATISDIESRIGRELTETEETQCTSFLDDAAVIIDAYNADAAADKKQIVSCRMVIRTIGVDDGVPVGATQGSMGALGYSQSWTISNGSTGELYLSKLEKQLLGVGNKIGSHSPTEEMVYGHTGY